MLPIERSLSHSRMQGVVHQGSEFRGEKEHIPLQIGGFGERGAWDKIAGAIGSGRTLARSRERSLARQLLASHDVVHVRS